MCSYKHSNISITFIDINHFVHGKIFHQFKFIFNYSIKLSRFESTQTLIIRQTNSLVYFSNSYNGFFHSINVYLDQTINTYLEHSLHMLCEHNHHYLWSTICIHSPVESQHPICSVVLILIKLLIVSNCVHHSLTHHNHYCRQKWSLADHSTITGHSHR